jgi:hypothetical protein
MHFITGKSLPRRTFLRGAGASVALPLLDAMIPAGRPWRSSTAAASGTRLICIEESHGAAGCSDWGASQSLFAPETLGRDFSTIPASQLTPLLDFRDYLTVITNTDSRMAEAFEASQIGGDHHRTAAVFLTQSHPKHTRDSDVFVGRSLDQVHAKRFGQDTVLPSLELCIEGEKAGGCQYGYHCYYETVISWESPSRPLPPIREPRTAFERLFGVGDSDADRRQRRRTRASLLDWLAEDVARLRSQVSAADGLALEEHLTQIREIERRIEIVETRNTSGEERALPEAPAGVPDSWMEHMEIMFDLQVAAFRGDVTRVVSFKTGADLSNRTFPESGVNGSFHGSSHHGNRPEAILDFHTINTFRLSAVRYLLQKLHDTTEEGAPLLDRTAIVWGSSMGDPNLHNHRRCPLLLMGKANGGLTGNVHLRAPTGTPMANAYLGLLHALGHDDLTYFGDSTAAFPLDTPGTGPSTSESREG